MYAKNVSIKNVQDALAKTNEKYDNNIIFNRLESTGRGVKFTLTVRNSKKAGARRGISGRRIAAACWHVHGDLFDALINIQPEVIIRTSSTHHIDKDGGNWQDRNIGSMMQPMMFSKACECK
jgi:hypothetical protein